MQECRMAKVENIVGEKLIITRAVNMTLHVGPARVVHEVDVWKLCGIGGLLPHPHPDESELFEDRIGPGDRGLRDAPVAVRVEDTSTIRIETHSVVGALQMHRDDLSLGDVHDLVWSPFTPPLAITYSGLVEASRIFH